MSLADQVLDLLGRETRHVTALQKLLETESQHARAKNGAGLEAVAVEKRQAIEMLEACAEEKRALLAAQGLSAGAEGFEQLLATLGPRRQEAENLWATLKELLETAQKTNQMNGLILDGSLRAAHAALSVLLGHGRDSDTYNSHGTLSGNRAGRTSIKV